MNIKPVILPAVAHKAVIIVIAFKPRLKIYRRTVVVRRVHKLVPVLAEINREVLNAS